MKRVNLSELFNRFVKKLGQKLIQNSLFWEDPENSLKLEELSQHKMAGEKVAGNEADMMKRHINSVY